MAKDPNFDKVTDTITQADIDKFLRSAGPGDFKELVMSAPDQRTKMRFVAGYLIRNKQVTAERLNGKKPVVVSAAKTRKRIAAANAAATSAAAEEASSDSSQEPGNESPAVQA